MSKIGIFYGTNSGNTEDVASKIKEQFGADADIFDVSKVNADSVLQYDNLIFGASTWGAGDVQDDFESFINKLESIDLSGKKVAIFGLGDSSSYGDTFANAIGHIYDAVKNAEIIGQVSAEDYSFEETISVENGLFYGLPIDEDNESDKTDSRIASWVSILKERFN